MILMFFFSRCISVDVFQYMYSDKKKNKGTFLMIWERFIYLIDLRVLMSTIRIWFLYVIFRTWNISLIYQLIHSQVHYLIRVNRYNKKGFYQSYFYKEILKNVLYLRWVLVQVWIIMWTFLLIKYECCI